MAMNDNANRPVSDHVGDYGADSDDTPDAIAGREPNRCWR